MSLLCTFSDLEVSTTAAKLMEHQSSLVAGRATSQTLLPQEYAFHNTKRQRFDTVGWASANDNRQKCKGLASDLSGWTSIACTATQPSWTTASDTQHKHD